MSENLTTERDVTPEPDTSRRDLIGKLLGLAAGGAALQALAGCVTQTAESGGEQVKVGEATQSIEGPATVIYTDAIGTTPVTSGGSQNLRGTTGAQGTIAVAEGFSSKGDGGGGIFYWDTTTTNRDDGGTYIVPTTNAPDPTANPPTTGSTGAGWRRIYSGRLNVKWFGAGNGTGDVAAFKNALAAGAGKVVVVPPGTYTLGDPSSQTVTYMNIPSNTHLSIQLGATVTLNFGRWTAYNVNNVVIHIDGLMKSTNLPNSDSGISDWGTGSERGFIEFGGISGTPAAGFTCSGSGSVIGDWTGSPSAFLPPSSATNTEHRKGIAIWEARDVTVQGLEVTGFEGEAVYYNCGATPTELQVDPIACYNVLFDRIHSHHNNFNGLNFNVSVAQRGFRITNCHSHDNFQGIEASIGDIIGNYCNSNVSIGIQYGAGTGLGPLIIANNVCENSGTNSSASYSAGVNFNLQFSQPSVYDNLIVNNVSIDSAADGFVLQNLGSFMLSGNIARAWASRSNGYAFNIQNCQYGLVQGNTTNTVGVGGHSQGLLYTAGLSNVTLGPNNTGGSGFFFNPNPTSQISQIESPATTTVAANGGTFAIGTNQLMGLLFITANVTGVSGIVALMGTYNGTRVALDPFGGYFSTMPGNHNTFNIYWDGAHYVLENQSSVAQTFALNYVGTAQH